MELEIEKRYCQSCGMPLDINQEELLGTNGDQTKCDEYCVYCYQNGRFKYNIVQESKDPCTINIKSGISLAPLHFFHELCKGFFLFTFLMLGSGEMPGFTL